MKLLARLYDPTEGQILLDGVDLREFDPVEWRAQMAVVFQDYCRFQMTLRENIGVGDTTRIDHLATIISAAERGGAASLSEKFTASYETMLGKMFEKDTTGGELSGGEWQKVALARAFMRSRDLSKNGTKESAENDSNSRNAQLLILDEPTASLDVQSEYDVYCRFHEITEGKMTLLISHRFSTGKIADKILVLENGKVKEEGSHEQLIAAAGNYAELYNLQADRYR